MARIAAAASALGKTAIRRHASIENYTIGRTRRTFTTRTMP